MKPVRTWKIVVALVLVFSAGAVTGSILTQVAVKRAFEQSLKFENWTASAVAHLEKKLGLSPDQKTRIQTVMEDMGRQLQGTFSKTIEESGRIVVQSGKRVDQELTVEQRALHAEMKKQFRAGLKKTLKIDLPEE